MLNFNNLLSRALLAFALVTGAGAAFAGPTYHVDIDTSALAGSSGYLDFLIADQGNDPATTATLSGFSGNFSGLIDAKGNVAGSTAAGASVSTGGGWNELAFWAGFGGRFGFDVSFEQETGAMIGSLFQVALLDADFLYLAPTTDDIARFDLQPGQPIALSGSPFATISLVSEVPEPTNVAMMLTGLALLGFTLRRRAQ